MADGRGGTLYDQLSRHLLNGVPRCSDVLPGDTPNCFFASPPASPRPEYPASQALRDHEEDLMEAYLQSTPPAAPERPTAPEKRVRDEPATPPAAAPAPKRSFLVRPAGGAKPSFLVRPAPAAEVPPPVEKPSVPKVAPRADPESPPPAVPVQQFSIEDLLLPLSPRSPAPSLPAPEPAPSPAVDLHPAPVPVLSPAAAPAAAFPEEEFAGAMLKMVEACEGMMVMVRTLLSQRLKKS